MRERNFGQVAKAERSGFIRSEGREAARGWGGDAMVENAVRCARETTTHGDIPADVLRVLDDLEDGWYRAETQPKQLAWVRIWD